MATFPDAMTGWRVRETPFLFCQAWLAPLSPSFLSLWASLMELGQRQKYIEVGETDRKGTRKDSFAKKTRYLLQLRYYLFINTVCSRELCNLYSSV